MNNRCKHGFIQDQCGVCKHLPPYKEPIPYNSLTPIFEKGDNVAAVKFKNEEEFRTMLNIPKENKMPDIENEIKQSEIITTDDNRKVCLICGGKHHARGLCSRCWTQWRHGKIEHPILGPFKVSDKGAIIVESKKKNSIEPNDGFENDKSKDGHDPYFSELRARLKDAQVFCKAICMATGKEKDIKQEIHCFLGDWI